MKFADLVDLSELQSVCESFTALTGAVTAVLDLEGNVLVATGWQDVCTRYHRRCPASAARCRESDTVLASRLSKGARWNLYECKNGLVDAAAPVVIAGQHVANFFTGQFLFALPDKARFDLQAAELGLDRDEYWAALQSVPVFTEAYARKLMTFLGSLAAAFGELGFARMKAEAAAECVKSSEERFALAMAATQNGLWDWNTASDEVYFSPSYFEMLGYLPDEHPYHLSTWERLVHSEDWPAVAAEIQACLDNCSERFELEYRMRHHDGTWHWISARGLAVARDQKGRALRVIGTHSDVTARRHAEERNRQLEFQLAQAQKLESIGRLAGGVAHDFNNMLAVILGHVEIALDAVQETDPLKGDLEQIQQAANRSKDLALQLLAFARKQEITPVAVDLNNLVECAFKMLQRLIGENITVQWRPAAELWTIKADPSQLSQVLTNLCVNARDAIVGIGQLTIETANCSLTDTSCIATTGATPGDYVCLTVSDTGCGMDAATQSQIFEPFFSTRGKKGGTGLGLSTVYGAVCQNGGFIEVHSVPNHGSTFTVWLPRYLGSAVVPVRAAPLLKTSSATILLVEDDTAVLTIERKMLERISHRVLATNSPKEALSIAIQCAETIDLLVTDVVMPEMNGRELVERLRVHRPGLRCLYISGYTADAIAHQGIIEENVHFVSKPFSRDQLANAVQAALEDDPRPGALSATSLSRPGFSI